MCDRMTNPHGPQNPHIPARIDPSPGTHFDAGPRPILVGHAGQEDVLRAIQRILDENPGIMDTLRAASGSMELTQPRVGFALPGGEVTASD